jgi:hypothetical protein
MIDRTERRFRMKPAVAGSADNLGWLVDMIGIAPHAPVIDKSAPRRRHVQQVQPHL